MKLKNFLKSFKLFEGLDEKLINEISIHAERQKFKKGELIILKGEESTDMYVILKGKVNIITSDADGHELIVATLSEGDFFGELSLIDGEPRSMSVEALTDVEVAVIKRNIFLNVLRKNPDICLNLAKNLAKRVRETDELLETLVFLDVKRRIIKFFKEKRLGKKDNRYIVRKLTHSEIAKRIGASRESVSKAIKNLIEHGILSENENHFLVMENSIYEE